jgi:hypothetical protein
VKLVKQDEIELQLREEKKKFVDASRKAARAIRHDLNIFNWLKQYPGESAILIIAAGFVLGYVVQRKRLS